MKSVEISQNEHSNLNQGIKDLLKWATNAGVKVEFKLADRMKERNLTVRQVSELTGLRIATISDIMNGKKGSLNFAHIFILMAVLRIHKLDDIVSFHIPTVIDNVHFKTDSLKWIETGEIPESTKICSAIAQEKYKIDWEFDYFSCTSFEEIWENLIPVKKE